MKITGAIVVEVLLAGAMSFIWIFLLIIRITGPTINQIETMFNLISSSSAIFLAIYSGVSYVLGWSISFLAESIMDPLFQTRYRNKYFKSLNLNFYDVRSVVFKNCPDHVVKDIEYDRQLIRIARSNTFNFAVLAIITSTFTGNSDFSIKFINTISVLCGTLSLLSFFQWRYRYKTTFFKFMDLYRVVVKCESSDIHTDATENVSHISSSRVRRNRTARKK